MRHDEHLQVLIVAAFDHTPKGRSKLAGREAARYFF